MRGCRTTLAVADKLNRRWIGVGLSRTACDVMRKRLGKKNVRIIGVTDINFLVRLPTFNAPEKNHHKVYKV